MNRKTKKIYKIEDAHLYLDLPAGSDTDVKQGAKIRKGKELYTKIESTIIESHYLPKSLGINPNDAKSHIGRVSGQYVNKGDLLGERLSAGGLVTKRVLAESEGIVSTNRLSSGYIDILSESDEVTVKSPVSGEVSSVVRGKHIVIKTHAYAYHYAIHRNLEKAVHHVDVMEEEDVISGTLDIVGDGSSIYAIKDLKDSYAGKIVLAGRFVYPEVARELYQREATAVIAYSMDYLEYRELGVPTIILGGFGQIGSGMYLYERLLSSEGATAELDVINNRLLLFGIDADNIKETEMGKDFVGYANEIEVGAKVRSQDVDTYGMYGMVVEISDEKGVSLLVVEKSDGARFIVEDNAVELIV